MKKFLAGCALVISVFPAMAADMPFNTPSPPPAPFFTWTGCYLGGSLGGIWRSTNNVGIGIADGGSGAAVAAAAGSIPIAYDVGTSGWIVSGQTGCNYQVASWVFGIETDISNGLDAGATVATNVAGFFPLTSSVSQDMSWIGTTRGRLGWTPDKIPLVLSGACIDFDAMKAAGDLAKGIYFVGSSGAVTFRLKPDGTPELIKEAKVEFVDDGPGKAVGINRFIGRRPILAFGNSDGDQQMLEWTAAGDGPRLMGLIHHTDAEHEYAYDRNSPIGRLDKAWDEAMRRGWTVVDMKTDWKVIYPFEKK